MQVCTCVSASRVISLSAVFWMFMLRISICKRSTKRVHLHVALPRPLSTIPFALCLHYVLWFSVWIFSSRTEPPSPSQKVSKRFRAMCWGLNFARRRSYSTCVPMAMYCCRVRLRLVLWNGLDTQTDIYLDVFIVFSCWHFVISSPAPPCRLLHDPTPRSRMSRAMEWVRREVSSTAVVLYKGALSEQILRGCGNL